MVIQFDGGEHILMRPTSSRILVGFFHQLSDGSFAITGYCCRLTQSSGHELVVDDQQTVIISGDELFHNDPSGNFLGFLRAATASSQVMICIVEPRP